MGPEGIGLLTADCIVYLGKDAPFAIESPTQKVSVLIQNGSSTPNAAAATANILRGLGYPISGIGNAPPQQGTTIACRNRHGDDAHMLRDNLRHAIAGEATLVRFPDPAPAGAENAVCIVTLEQ